jgi:hypothetical protein
MATVAYADITDEYPVREYITADQIQNYANSIDPLAIDWDNRFDSDSIEELIQEWSVWVENETGAKFFQYERTVDIDGSGALLVALPDHPVSSVSELQYVYPVDNSSDINLDYIHVDTDGNASFLRKSTRWAHGQKNLRVTYVAGYSYVPKWIFRTIRIMAAMDIFERAQGGSGTGARIKAGPVEIDEGSNSRLGPNGVPLSNEYIRCLQNLRDYENVVITVAKGYIPEEPATDLLTSREKGDARV